MAYVVAFNRDRDFYQVPLALRERGLFAGLATDLYYPDAALLRTIPGMAALAHRRADGLPSSEVRWSLPSLAWQILGPRFGIPPRRVFRGVGAALSRAALRLARRRNAHLLLYSECALEAFAAPEAAHMVKGLFAFHPHTALISEILKDDFARHPECAWSYAQEGDTAAPGDLADRLNGEWSRADFVIAASSFTRRSFIHAGCPAERIHVVPYGAGIVGAPFRPESKPSDRCRLLFVGQGTQRKGLHHLLRAWAKLAPRDAELVVIASVMDPGIAALAGPGVVVLPRQSRASLLAHYAGAHIFVMPSLVEGFGLVYTEALAGGAFVIGTPNTGLPDLGLPDWAGAVVSAGSVDLIAAALNDAIGRWRDGRLDAAAIRGFAETLTWDRFRAGIGDVAGRYHRR